MQSCQLGVAGAASRPRVPSGAKQKGYGAEDRKTRAKPAAIQKKRGKGPRRSLAEMWPLLYSNCKLARIDRMV